MNRIPVSIRTLILLPLLAAGVDLTRATAACGAHAQTCLEAAGRGWLGPAAAVLIVLYALATARFVARHAHGHRRSFTEMWLLGTTGVAVACTGQAILARAFSPDAALGGSPLGVLALCAVAGAVLAFLLRLTDDLAERAPRAPRLGRRRPEPAVVYVRTDDGDPRAAARRAPRGRAPPSL